MVPLGKAGMFTWQPSPVAALCQVPEMWTVKPELEAEPLWKAPGSGNCPPWEVD